MMLRGFRRWAGDDLLVSTITLAEVELGFFAAWEGDFERRNKRSPTTVATERRLRVAVFDLLIGTDGSIIRNPLSSLEIPSAATPRRDHLSPAAVEELIAAART